MKKNKKGSHVSFIISFILFISFLIFFIGIINPFEKTETGKSSLLKHLENEIINNVSAEVLVVSALENQGLNCLEIDNLNIENYITRREGDFLKIYSFDEFPEKTFQCAPPSKYKIGLVRKQKYVLESKVENLKYKYENNYETLKTDFKIPDTNDFEFSFLDVNKKMIIETSSKETPPTEVLAELIPVTYLDETDIKIKNGYIKVILW